MNHEFTFSDAVKARAVEFSDANARVDSETKDPDNQARNKAASALAEIAAKRAYDKIDGYEAELTDGFDVEAGDEEDYDLRLQTPDGDVVRIDVKARISDDGGDSANLMPGGYIERRPASLFDAYVQVWVRPDLKRAEVVGFATREYFQSESEFFFGCHENRLLKKNLKPLDSA